MEEGIDIGNVIGRVQLLQELLGEPVVSTEELREKLLESLQAQANELKQLMADRRV